MSPTTQLVNLFSPNPNDTHSGRITPSSVGGVNSGKSSALTTDSNATGAVSLDMQQNPTIHPPDYSEYIRIRSTVIEQQPAPLQQPIPQPGPNVQPGPAPPNPPPAPSPRKPGNRTSYRIMKLKFIGDRN